jgi:hypothetical protein
MKLSSRTACGARFAVGFHLGPQRIDEMRRVGRQSATRLTATKVSKRVRSWISISRPGTPSSGALLPQARLALPGND